MTISRWIAAVVIAGLSAGTGSARQTLELQIVSPAEGTFVSDQVTLEARILPVERRGEVTDVTFFADGKLVCRSANVQLPRCNWNAGPVIRSHLVRVVAMLASGDRVVANTRTRDIDYVESANVQLVQVNVSVIDRRGLFVPGLTQNDFSVSEDGRPQKIVHFATEEAPIEIVVAMDVSGSMGAAIEDLKVAVKQFLASLKPSDQVTLVAFNEEMFILSQRETAAAARSRAVDRVGAWGGTSLYDVIIRSIELLSRTTGRRSLVVFSDGEDKSSRATLETVDRAIKSSDATLFMVGLGRGREVKALKDTLESLAEPSGGRAIFADRPSELGRAFTEILQELKHQYLLGYEPTNVTRDGGWRRLAAELPGMTHRVRARQGYFAPTP